jgi:hypothetical protein
MPNRFVDNVYVLKFVRILTRPWKEQPAFKLGVIDKYGNIVVPKEKQTPQQRNSYTKFDVLVWNIKKLIEKVPLGKTVIAKYIAALKLLKEEVPASDYKLIEKVSDKYIIETHNLSEDDLILIEDGDGGGGDSGGGEASAVTNTTSGVEFSETPWGTGRRSKRKKRFKNYGEK